LRLLSALFAAWLACAPAVAQPDSSRQLFQRIDDITRELEKISGFQLKHRVPSDFITKAKVNEFLKKRVKEVASPEEIRAEELTLKKFGLVPPDFDLAKNTVDLLTEQAAAFYDYNAKKLFITETTSTDTQEPVLVHELAHALADQNFNLAKFIKQGRKSDDGATARLAVMEGQASWLMAEFLARRTGQSLKDSPALVSMMSRMTESGAGQFPVFDQSPLYLRQTLIFPYSSGMLFQHAVYLKDGQPGLAEVFRRPPVSTQQILHADKYFAGLTPTLPALPEPPRERGYKSLVGGTLGELDHAVLIEQYGGKALAGELAPHWRGCQFELRENRKQKRVILLYAVEWDDAASAGRYFDFYREALARKWKKMEVGSTAPDSVSGSGDDGRFVLRRAGSVVTSIEGLTPAVN
jgi:hypothetical protein